MRAIRQFSIRQLRLSRFVVPATKAVVTVSSDRFMTTGYATWRDCDGAKSPFSMSMLNCIGLNTSTSRRTMASLMKPSTSVGSNPLDILQKECAAKKRCDDTGRRLKTTDHWALSVAIGSTDPNLPPNLRTVSIAQLSSDGIDFVMKRPSSAARSAASGSPISVLYQEGKFLPGQSAEQWRGEGYCETIPLSDIIDLVPLFTATSMIASCRIKEMSSSASTPAANVSDDRMAILNRSRTTEVMQTTRNDLENHKISMDELEKYIIAFRFKPRRLEYMSGGPDTIMWDRWEWLYSTTDNDWANPNHLIPH